MRNGYVRAKCWIQAARIATEIHGPPTFKGRVIEWANAGILMCPEGTQDSDSWVYLRADREDCYDTFDAMMVAAALLADQRS